MQMVVEAMNGQRTSLTVDTTETLGSVMNRILNLPNITAGVYFAREILVRTPSEYLIMIDVDRDDTTEIEQAKIFDIEGTPHERQVMHWLWQELRSYHVLILLLVRRSDDR